MTREVALIATFCAAAAAAASAVAWREAVHGALARRLAAVGGGPVQRSRAVAEPEEAEAGFPPQRAGARRLLRLLAIRPPREGRVPGGAEPGGSALMLQLRQAGLRLRPEEYRGLVAALAAGLGLLGLMRLGVVGAVAGAGLGAALPRFWLRARAAGRRRDFAEQLPDALALMSNALRSGHSFLQAAELCGDELPEPAGGEWRRVLQETRVNIALEDALGNLLARVGGDDLDLLVTAVLIQRQVGGNLAEVLDRIAETLRQRVRLRGEVRALTAQGRLSGWIVGALPGALLVLVSVVNPSYMAPLIGPGIGRILLVVAAVFEGIGALMIRKLVNVEF
jgi:tight adherence protein B